MSGRRVLVVEDDVDCASELAELLDWEGFAVTCAHDVASAMVALERTRFDVLLVDLELGRGGSGIDVVMAARAVADGAAPLVALVSGRLLAAAEAALLQPSVPAVLPKPLSIDRLLAEIGPA